MEIRFKVGDAVQSVEGNIRMKVEAIDKTDGRVTCSWKRGPAMHRKKFHETELAPGSMSAFPPPVVRSKAKAGLR